MGTIVAPLVAIALIGATYWSELWRRDKELPILEMGSWYMLAIVAYSCLPLLQYALSGAQLSPLSHGRLYKLNPEPHEFATPAWGYAFLMLGFSLAYLGLRPASPKRASLIVPKRTVLAVISVFVLLNVVFLALRVLYGLNFATGYDASLYEHAAARESLPLVARQFVDHGDHILMILSAAVTILLVRRWKSWTWRVVLIAWLVASMVDYLFNPGSRFRLIALVLFVLMAYHRFVRPVRVRSIIVWGVSIAIFFFSAGILRSGYSVYEQGQVVQVVTENPQLAYSTVNEFQIHYGSALEFRNLLNRGYLDPIPWQLYFSDLLLFIPQQLLPFEKIDPVKWYVERTGDVDFFSFGVLAQSMLGLGWLEMVFRGLLVGIVLAVLRRWWVRNNSQLWPNVLYLWMSVVIYQAARNTTFYFVVLILLEFLPLLVIVWLIERLVSVRPHERDIPATPSATR
jgi:hypothetical protein